MLAATPCVVTDVGDAAMMVGETGWVAPPADPEALAGRIEEAYRAWRADPSAWAGRCAAARERMVANFSLERMANEYEAIWRDLARRR